MLTRFLFWNVRRRPLDNLIAAAALEWEVDIVILAECPEPPPSALGSLARDGAGTYRSPTRIGRDLRLYTRLQGRAVRQFSAEEAVV